MKHKLKMFYIIYKMSNLVLEPGKKIGHVINPHTKREIKEGGPTHKELIKAHEAGTTYAKSERKAPHFSAAGYNVGTQMRGPEGGLYIVKARSDGTHYWASCLFRTSNCTDDVTATPITSTAVKYERKSPNISAKDAGEGNEMIGADGQNYIVKRRSDNVLYWFKCAHKGANCKQSAPSVPNLPVDYRRRR
jgi:hypothetical protein